MASFLDNSDVPWWADAARRVPKSVLFGAMGGPLGALAGTAASMVGDDTPESLVSRHARGIKQRAAMRGMFKTPGQTLAMDAPGEYHNDLIGRAQGGGSRMMAGQPFLAPPQAQPPMPPQPLGPMPPPPGPQGPPGAPPSASPAPTGGPGGSPWWMQAVNGMSPGVSQGLRGPNPNATVEAPPGPPMSLSPPNPGPMAPPPSQGGGFNFFSPIGKGLDGAVNDSAALVKKFYQDTFGQ